MNTKKESGSLRFLYHSAPGRLILRLLTCRGISKICGAYLDSPLSRGMIGRFAKKNSIDLSQYEEIEYKNFNQFFARKIKPEMRKLDPDPHVLTSPCDGLLSAYRIEDGLVLPIKQSEYSISSLLGGDPIAERYRDGICLVFRLCVDHYHRYNYIDNGVKGENVFIPGRLHTVRPIALERHPVFVQNCREYTVMESENFGALTQIEVGAMLVGKIKNNHGAGKFALGEEKGCFLYGGSTIVLLLERDAVSLDERFFEETANETETPIKLGERLGYSKKAIYVKAGMES